MDIWQALQYIGTGLSLVAFGIAGLLLGDRVHLANGAEIMKSAPETARLEETVAAYRDALKERTRERVPLQWAASLGNEGVAMILLAERTKNATMAETAYQQIEVAWETMQSS